MDYTLFTSNASESKAPSGKAAQRRSLRFRSGSALLGAMAAVFLLMILGVGLVAVTTQGIYATRRIEKTSVAFNYSESGAERAVRWMKDQPSPPTGTSSFDPFGGSQNLGTGTYQATVTPDPDNVSAPLKKFKIVASGTYFGRTQTVELILRQQSFGKYAYFTDKEVSSVTGGAIWFISSDRIRGPAHSNNVGGSNFRINWGGGPGPIFQDMVTAAGPSMTYAPTAPASEPDFLKIYLTGSRGYNLSVDNIPLPSSTDIQKAAAWGSTSGFPAVTGVYTPVNGGVYIHGDAAVVAQLDGSGNQQFRITQGATVTTITYDLAANVTKKQVGAGAVTTTAGLGTGVIFCQGNVTSLSGTIGNNLTSSDSPPHIVTRNAYTIATDVVGDKNIVVTGPIKYASAPDPTLSVHDPVNLKPGTLGLVARDVMIASGAPTNMEIDAVCLAGGSTVADGSFYVQNYNTKKPTGTLKVVGGIIQKGRGPVGTFSGSTLSTGYHKDYWYDPRLADNPPPYFPTTGLYDRVSWRRIAG